MVAHFRFQNIEILLTECERWPNSRDRLAKAGAWVRTHAVAFPRENLSHDQRGVRKKQVFGYVSRLLAGIFNGICTH